MKNRKCFKLNDNQLMTYQNLGDVAKTILAGKFTAINTCIRKGGRLKINELMHISRRQKRNSKINQNEVGKKVNIKEKRKI